MLGIGVAIRFKYNHDSKLAENHQSFTNPQSIPLGDPTREILSTKLKEVAHHFGYQFWAYPGYDLYQLYWPWTGKTIPVGTLCDMINKEAWGDV